MEQTKCGIMNALLKFRPDLERAMSEVPPNSVHQSIIFLKEQGLWDEESEVLAKTFNRLLNEYDNVIWHGGRLTPEQSDIEQERVAKLMKSTRDELMCRVARLIKASRTDESRLDELHLPKSPEFHQWFKGSKVVDDNGNPLPVFHGTSSRVHFDTPRPWSHFGTSDAAYDRVIPSDAMMGAKVRQAKTLSDVAPARTMPFYLNIKNPLEVKDPEDQHDPHMWMSVLWNTGKFDNLRRLEVAEMNGEERFYIEATSFLLAHGYDGIVYKNKWEDPGSLSWVPIHGDQIRTAITENLNETVEGEWGAGWHNTHTGEDIYEESMPHFPLANKHKDEIGPEIVAQMRDGGYDPAYRAGWVRYLWAFDYAESWMDFTSSDDTLKIGLPWIIETGIKYDVKKITVSNRYSDDHDKRPMDKNFILVDGNYVPEEQVRKN